MRTVHDESGNRYVLVKESAESSLVRDPETGERRHVPNDQLTTVTGESPLSTAAGAIPGPVRTLVTVARDERTLGVLVELEERGPLRVRELLSAYDLCESDLHGMTAELRAAGLLEETEVGGERGYELTDLAREALASVS